MILIFAAALRCFSLGSLGFWTDEFCSLSAADGWGLQLDKVPLNQIAPPLPVCTRLADAKSFFNIPAAMAHDDAHPPLYFLLLRIWEQMFGDGEAAVRSLNVVFSVLAIALLYFVARDSVGSQAALIACLLMAVATPQIQMSQEARNYMPVLVFSLVAAMAVERLRRSPGKTWACVFAVSLLAMMLTHYFAAGAAAGLVGYALLSMRGRARILIITGAIAAAICFAIFWGPALLSQRAVFENGLGWLADQAPGHVGRRFFDLCRLPVRFFAEVTDLRFQFAIAVVGAVMLVSLAILYVRRRELRLWILWLVASVALVAAADFSRSTTQLNWVRYTLFATPPAYVLLAAAIQRGQWRWILPAAATLLAVMSLPGAYIPAWKIDFRTPVQFVGRHLEPGDGLVIIGPDPIADGIMFAAFAHYLPKMPLASAVLTQSPNAGAVAQLRRCPHVWIVQLPPGHFTAWSGFTVQERQAVPYFAELLMGHFDE
jgi:mannosyltransferase